MVVPYDKLHTELNTLYRLIGLSCIQVIHRPSSQSLKDPANPDGVQTGANPVGRRCWSLEPVNDPVQSEVESFQTECPFPYGRLVPIEVVHVDRTTGNFYVQVSFNNILFVDDVFATISRLVEGVQVTVVAVDLGVKPFRQRIYGGETTTSTKSLRYFLHFYKVLCCKV